MFLKLRLTGFKLSVKDSPSSHTEPLKIRMRQRERTIIYFKCNQTAY